MTTDPKPLSAEERAEAMRLCDAATEGPWEPFTAKWNGRDRFFAQAMYPWPDEDGVRDEFDEIVLEGSVDAGLFFTTEEQVGNIRLAAASRTLIPRYEATVKQLEAEVEELKELYNDAVSELIDLQNGNSI